MQVDPGIFFVEACIREMLEPIVHDEPPEIQSDSRVTRELHRTAKIVLTELIP